MSKKQSKSDKADKLQSELAKAEATAPTATMQTTSNEGELMRLLRKIINLLESIDQKIGGQADRLKNDVNETINTTLSNIKMTAPEPEIKIVEKEVIVEKIVEKPVEVIVEKIIEKPTLTPEQKDLLATLLPWQKLCAYITQDEALGNLLIGRGFDGIESSQQLIRFFANAAQWKKIKELHEVLASRCKTEQRPANDKEQALLSRVLSIHNLIWNDSMAELVSSEIGTRLDAEQHQRGTTRGDTVTAVWLEGLRNAGGQLEAKILVELQ